MKDEVKTIIIRPEGRPKEDLTSLPIGWQDHLLNLYLVGASEVEIKAEIWKWRGSFSNDLWYRWLREYEEFREIVQMGKILSEAYFCRIGRENIKNSQFNAVLYIWTTKNRFGWNDKGVNNVEIPQQTIDYSSLKLETLKDIVRNRLDGGKRKD